jgi:hypothetical protein
VGVVEHPPDLAFLHGGWLDAARSRRVQSIDPTGTTGIRRTFRAAAQRQLNKWKQLVRVALLAHDVFGHSEYRAGKNLAVESVLAPAPRQYGWLPPDEKLRYFSQWMEQVWDQQMVKSQWWLPHLRAALAEGLRKAESETKTTGQNYRDVTALTSEQVKNEIAGIGAAAMHAVKRLVGDHVHKQTSPLLTYRDVSRAVDKIAGTRLSAMVNTYVVKGYNRVKLAVYRHNGVTHVGIHPERQLVRRKQPQSTLDAKKDENGAEDLANWLTAGDDKVCVLCEDASDDSPYLVDEIEDLIPLHVDCRCAWVPLWDRRFATEEL